MWNSRRQDASMVKSTSGIHRETNKRHGRLLPTAPGAYGGSVPWPGGRAAYGMRRVDRFVPVHVVRRGHRRTELDAATLATWFFKRGGRGAQALTLLSKLGVRGMRGSGRKQTDHGRLTRRRLRFKMRRYHMRPRQVCGAMRISTMAVGRSGQGVRQTPQPPHR